MRFQYAELELIILLLLITGTIQQAAGETPKCGKPQKGVLITQDFIRHPLGKPADPSTPSGVDEDILPRTISLRIMVNREGDVVHVCSMDQDRSPLPSVRALNDAARSAVSKWKYPRDFGLAGDLHLSYQFGQGIISFRFTSPTAATTH